MPHYLHYLCSVILIVECLTWSGCFKPEQDTPKGPQAMAVLYPTKGQNVSGTVLFTETAKGMQLSVDITGLRPGKHGFHIHEYGNCLAPDAGSAGGHFNPSEQKHGAPDDSERHLGDLGNITADEDGLVKRKWMDERLTPGGIHSIVGRSVIIHAGEDDFESQPSGNSGQRVACGVIGISRE